MQNECCESASSGRRAALQLPRGEQEFILRTFMLNISPSDRLTGNWALSSSDQESHFLSPSLHDARSALIFGSYQAHVEALLVPNDYLPCQQRYTAHRIFELIRVGGGICKGSLSLLSSFVTGRGMSFIRQSRNCPDSVPQDRGMFSYSFTDTRKVGEHHAFQQLHHHLGGPDARASVS